MTVKELFNTALEISGLGGSNIFETADVSERMLTIVNIVYSDIYHLGNKEGFQPLTDAQDRINLNDNELYDCAVYGVAMFIQNIMGTSEDYDVFKNIYLGKKQNLISKCEIKQVEDTFVKGCDF